MATLHNNIRNRTAKDYRISYINHITRHWRTFQDITGITALKKIQELKRIEIEYISPRDTNFAVTIRSDIVILPQTVMEKASEEAQVRRPMFTSNIPAGAAGFRLTSRGFRLRM